MTVGAEESGNLPETSSNLGSHRDELVDFFSSGEMFLFSFSGTSKMCVYMVNSFITSQPLTIFSTILLLVVNESKSLQYKKNNMDPKLEPLWWQLIHIFQKNSPRIFGVQMIPHFDSYFFQLGWLIQPPLTKLETQISGFPPAWSVSFWYDPAMDPMLSVN